MTALWKGKSEMARYLIEHCADVNISKDDGCCIGLTALMLSLKSGQPALAEILIRQGADVNAKAGGFGSVLDHAKKFQPQLVPLLKAHGAKSGLNN